MTDFRQTAFLNRVRMALGNPKSRPNVFTDPSPGVSAGLLEKIHRRTQADYQELLNRLTEAAEPLNLKVISEKDPAAAAASLAGLVRDKAPEWGTDKRVAAWDHPLIHRLNLSEALAGQNVPVDFTGPVDTADEAVRLKKIRRQVTDAYIGVTSADFCVVDSATLVMKTRPGHARSVSLVPSIHVAVIDIKQLIANLTELYALLKQDPDYRSEGITNCMTFISGPSKTADIEFTMVHGAHGPREMVICVITGGS